ncbi:MAG: pyridoxal phosphate-dependent aminotransferase [Alphaproteobacteria bacterium]
MNAFPFQLAAAMQTIGTETAFAVSARAQQLARTGKKIFPMGVGQPDFSPPPHVVEAMHQALRDGYHQYCESEGIWPLREAIAEDVSGHYATPFHPDQVVVTPGAKQALFFAIFMVGEPGAEILYPDPGYPLYRAIIGFSRATGVPYPLKEEDNFDIDAERILSRITPKTRLLILNSPANPTGGIIRPETFAHLAKGLQEHPHVLIATDDIYRRLVWQGKFHSIVDYPGMKERTILLDGFSKSYAMTGWRLGYGVFPKQLAYYANLMAINTHSSVNTAAQVAAVAALKGPQDSLHEMQRQFVRRRDHLVQGLNNIKGVNCHLPAGAFYAFPNITGTGKTSKELQTALLEEEGVACLPGTSFGDMGEGFLRFSYCASMEVIEEALHRFEKLLERKAI